MNRKNTKKRVSNFGRRTGLDLRAGKRIRKNNDGMEQFDDYWTSSDDNTIASTSSPLCSSPAILNVPRMSSFIKNLDQTPRKELPERINFVGKHTNVKEAHQSVNPKQITEKRKLLAKGRRTGTDLIAGKEIQTINGIENFDNYWTDSSALTNTHSKISNSTVTSTKYASHNKISNNNQESEVQSYISNPKSHTLIVAQSHVNSEALTPRNVSYYSRNKSIGTTSHSVEKTVSKDHSINETYKFDKISNSNQKSVLQDSFSNNKVDQSCNTSNAMSEAITPRALRYSSRNKSNGTPSSDIEKIVTKDDAVNKTVTKDDAVNKTVTKDDAVNKTVTLNNISSPKVSQSCVTSSAMSEALTPRTLRYLSRNENIGTPDRSKEKTVTKDNSLNETFKNLFHDVTQTNTSPENCISDDDSLLSNSPKNMQTVKHSPVVEKHGTFVAEQKKILIDNAATQTHDDSFLRLNVTNTTFQNRMASSSLKSSFCVSNSSTYKENEIQEENNDADLNTINHPELTSADFKSKKQKKKSTVKTNELRRSQRTKFPPLEHWRNQRLHVNYENGNIASVDVDQGYEPINTQIDRIRKAQERYQKLKNRVKSKKEKLQENSVNLKQIKSDLSKTEICNPQSGETELVYLYRPHDTLLWTAPSLQNQKDASYTIAKCFSGELISFGFIEIVSGKEKKKQVSPDHNIAFNVIKGNNIKIKIHKTIFSLKELDFVVVPAGNIYSIHNKGKTLAILSFSTFKTPMFDYQFPDNGNDHD